METCSSHLLAVCFKFCLTNCAISKIEVQVSSLLERNTEESLGRQRRVMKRDWTGIRATRGKEIKVRKEYL